MAILTKLGPCAAKAGASLEMPVVTMASVDAKPRGHSGISGSCVGTLGEQGSTSWADGWAKEGEEGSSCWPGRRRSGSDRSQADVACLGTNLRHILCSLRTNMGVSVISIAPASLVGAPGATALSSPAC